MTMKYYRVQYGFGKDDFFSVDETDLQKALKAQLTGAIVVLKEGTLNGERILTIKPDYQREMGWNRDYQLTGEDYQQIGTSRVNEYNLFFEDTKLALEGKARVTPKELSGGVKQLARSMTEPTWDRG